MFFFFTPYPSKCSLITVLSLKKFCPFLFAVFLFVNCEKSRAQEIRLSPDLLRSRSVSAFDSGNYASAARYYDALLGLFPKDPAYHYYLALSLIRGNIDPARGIELLKYPSVAEFYPDALYWQGEGYRTLYRFDEAISVYASCLADKQIPSAIKKNALLARAWADSARKAVQTPVNVRIYKEIFLGSGPPWPPFISVTGDTFILRTLPEIFLQRYSLQEIPPVWIVPLRPYDGSRLVFSLPGRWPKKYEQWESVFHQATGWDDFRPATEEKYPVPEFSSAFFSPADSVWCVSTSAMGTGQHDIFFSRRNNGKYHAERLAFPLNSAADEVAFFLHQEKKLAILVSNRNSGGRFLTAYEMAWPVSEAQSLPKLNDPVTLSHFPERVPYITGASATGAEKETIRQEKKPENGRSRTRPATPPVVMSGEDQSGYLALLNEALRLQLKSDSILRVAEEQKQNLSEVKEPAERTRRSRQISALFSKADSLQNLANVRYSLAREMEMKYLQKEIPRYRPPAKEPAGNSSAGESASTMKKDSEKTKVAVPAQKPSSRDTLSAVPPVKATDTGDVFEIRTVSPYSANSPIPLDLGFPEGVIYRIQIGAFSKPMKPDMFRGLYPVTGERAPESGIIRYYAGSFRSISAAEKALKKVKEYGFPEAFIVSWFQGKRISLIRARELEQMMQNP